MTSRASTGTTGKRWRMQCNRTRHCGHRFTLPRHPDDYARADKRKCPMCGGNARIVEHDRRREMAKRKVNGALCNCASVPYPHDKGTVLGCAHHESAKRDWTPQEVQDYQAMLETPRSDYR